MFKVLKYQGKNASGAIEKICALAIIFCTLAMPAHATDEVDPFAMDASHWISFDHYKEKTKHGQAYVEETPAPVVTAPATASTQPAAAGVAELAVPTRPLDPPLLPGVNKDFSLRVDSTADSTGPMAQIANLEKQPTVQLPAFSWQKAGLVAKQYATDPSGVDTDRPLNVRMSYLPEIPQPDNYVKPPVSARVRNVLEQHRPAPKKPDELTAEDKADLAAVKAYKDQQLQALQNDRQTLKALQDAISQLGLQKQLNFMAGAEGGVANTPENPNAPVKQ